jgi:hypothetical protein
MLEVAIPIPDHTTLSRRLKTLGEIPFRTVEGHRPIHLLGVVAWLDGERRFPAFTSDGHSTR